MVGRSRLIVQVPSILIVAAPRHSETTSRGVDYSTKDELERKTQTTTKPADLKQNITCSHDAGVDVTSAVLETGSSCQTRRRAANMRTSMPES